MLTAPLPQSTLFGPSGVSLLIGGLIGTIAIALHPQRIDDPLSAPLHLALYSATPLLFFGLAFEDPLHSVLAFTVIPLIGIADLSAIPLSHGRVPVWKARRG